EVTTIIHVMKPLTIRRVGVWHGHALPQTAEEWNEVQEGDGGGSLQGATYALYELPKASTYTEWIRYYIVGGAVADPKGTWAEKTEPDPKRLWWSQRLHGGSNKIEYLAEYNGLFLSHARDDDALEETRKALNLTVDYDYDLEITKKDEESGDHLVYLIQNSDSGERVRGPDKKIAGKGKYKGKSWTMKTWRADMDTAAISPPDWDNDRYQDLLATASLNALFSAEQQGGEELPRLRRLLLQRAQKRAKHLEEDRVDDDLRKAVLKVRRSGVVRWWPAGLRDAAADTPVQIYLRKKGDEKWSRWKPGRVLENGKAEGAGLNVSLGEEEVAEYQLWIEGATPGDCTVKVTLFEEDEDVAEDVAHFRVVPVRVGHSDVTRLDNRFDKCKIDWVMSIQKPLAHYGKQLRQWQVLREEVQFKHTKTKIQENRDDRKWGTWMSRADSRELGIRNAGDMIVRVLNRAAWGFDTTEAPEVTDLGLQLGGHWRTLDTHSHTQDSFHTLEAFRLPPQWREQGKLKRLLGQYVRVYRSHARLRVAMAKRAEQSRAFGFYRWGYVLTNEAYERKRHHPGSVYEKNILEPNDKKNGRFYLRSVTGVVDWPAGFREDQSIYGPQDN
ncbi:MAG: hypothetical protein R6U98_04995, partial [Pirellulaceae bacterium]